MKRVLFLFYGLASDFLFLFFSFLWLFFKKLLSLFDFFVCSSISLCNNPWNPFSWKREYQSGIPGQPIRTEEDYIWKTLKLWKARTSSHSIVGGFFPIDWWPQAWRAHDFPGEALLPRVHTSSGDGNMAFPKIVIISPEGSVFLHQQEDLNRGK